LERLAWANNERFPPGKKELPGHDPLIGQVVDPDNEGTRSTTGADPDNTSASLNLGLQRWVVPRGGEYFFSPSISTLRDVFARAAPVNGELWWTFTFRSSHGRHEDLMSLRLLEIRSAFCSSSYTFLSLFSRSALVYDWLFAVTFGSGTTL
jgi:hypothetical protein